MHSRSRNITCFLFALWIVGFCVTDSATTVYKYFRRDYVLDNTLYPEIYPTPNIGGKVHIIFTANKDVGSTTYPNYTKPFTVSFGGNASFVIDTDSSLPSYINWMYCDYEQLTGQVWISAHLSDDYLLGSLTEIAVTDSNGDTMGKTTSVGFSHSGLELLYVAIDQHSGGIETEQQIVMHFYNYYDDAPFNVCFVSMELLISWCFFPFFFLFCFQCFFAVNDPCTCDIFL